MGGLKNDCFLKLRLNFFALLGHVASRGEKKRRAFMMSRRFWDFPGNVSFQWWRGWAFGIPRGCLSINSRMCLPLAFFLLRFFSGSAFSSTFCVSSFSSEALGFSVGNTHVVTVTALRISSPFASLHSVRSLSLPSPHLCLLCWLFLACWASFFATGSWYWFLGLFFGGFWSCFGCV